MSKVLMTAAIAILIAAGCDYPTGTAALDPTARTSPGMLASKSIKSLNLIGSDAKTIGKRGGETYPEYNATRIRGRSSDSFGGYGCVNGCGGHATGFRWARDEGITDAEDCRGNSWSFIEGCAAFASRVYVREGGDEDIERGL
jgi:hypothetical protein